MDVNPWVVWRPSDYAGQGWTAETTPTSASWMLYHSNTDKVGI